MQNRVIIFLQSIEPAQASWVIVDAAHQIIQSVVRGDLTQLSVPQQSDIYIIVPAQDVLLTSAELPTLSRQKLLQALPFALEEHLIDDVSELHFAIGKHQENNRLPVAIVSKQKINAWNDLLKSLNLSPRAMIPAIFCLPLTEHEWQANTHGNTSIVRTGKYSGFGCETDNLDTLLALKSAEESSLPTIIRTALSEQQLMEKIASEIDSLEFINLLQGPYQAKPQAAKLKKIWLIAGCAAAVWILLAFASKTISYFILSHQANTIETAINTIYHRNFPQATSIVAPRDRMEAKLRAVSGLASKNNFLGMISNLGKTLTEVKGINIQNMDFRNQLMTLEVSAATFDNLDTLTRGLTQQGLSVKQQNAATSGTQVKATLLVRAGAV